mgnify:CR=1 FL=1
MGLTDFIRSQFIEIIEWNDDSRDTLSYRWPDDDKEIKNGAQLIVRESQNVQFVYVGQYADLFGPGKHSLTTENIPILFATAAANATVPKFDNVFANEDDTKDGQSYSTTSDEKISPTTFNRRNNYLRCYGDKGSNITSTQTSGVIDTVSNFWYD